MEKDREDIQEFQDTGDIEDINTEPSSSVSSALESIETLDKDFDWSVQREGKYERIQDKVIQGGGSKLEANIVSGAVKLLDILKEKDIELRERGILRTTDWDGVVKALENEESEGIYPGIAEAKSTYPASKNEVGEAVITARGLDYIQEMTQNILGWRNEIALAAENGNVIQHDGNTMVRDMDGYRPEDVSHLTTRPLANFQQLLRRRAAENDRKLIFGKSFSPSRLTVSVEEVESTGLRGDGFYAENFKQDTQELRQEIENVAKAFDYPNPEVVELGEDEEYQDVPWFKESNPIVIDDGRIIYSDNSNANDIMDEVLKKQLPYQEIRYSTDDERNDLIVLEHDEDSEDIDRADAIELVEEAAYLSKITRGDEIEVEENVDGWIDAYVGLGSDGPVKERAAQEIADMNHNSNQYEDSLIFHMDDKETGVMLSDNTVPFVKEGHGGHRKVEEEDIDYVGSRAFTDFYLTVSEALHRYENSQNTGENQNEDTMEFMG